MAKAEFKTQENNADVEQFLSSIDDAQKRADAQAICRLIQKATGEQPKMWGSNIVGFGKYSYKYASGREGEWMVTGFSPRKANHTIYIMEGYDNHKELLARLGTFTTGKSCLYIKRLADVDEKVLSELVKASYEYFRSNGFRLKF